MKTTDITERGLELLIASDLTGIPPDQIANRSLLWDAAPAYGGSGYVLGNPADYDRDHALDLVKLLEFLRATQPKIIEQFALDEDNPERRKFLARLQGEITKRGTIDVLRKGIKHGPANVDLFYGTPSPGNQRAKELFDANIFSVTRQLQYSKDETQLALDLCLFINGLPIATFELKNRLTKQTVEDAVQQYKRDRNPNELLFRFGRCMAHFAMDDQEVRFCTHLNGENSWFLPFNKGYNDGAGNPPNPSGIKTDYLWRRVLTREGLTDIIENYAQVVEKKDERTGKKQRLQIFPRYHQLDVVRKLLADVQQNGVGKRYLIQHSAGSGKSYSITWLSRQLMEVKQEDKPVFDSVIVVTDRRILDSQIRDNIKQFTEVSSTVGHAKDSGVKAVQTLSRLNRAHPKKYDTLVLDFKNDADTIRMAFEDYYRTTILSEETDPNKLHDLKSDLDNYQVYSSSQVDRLVGLYLTGSDRDRLDPILDMCVDTYRNTLDEDEQIDFKGKAKGFVRTYGFLASILPYSNLHWEKLSIFLNFLIPKLPAPTSEDLSKGILETIDMDSYRVEVRSTMAIELMDEDKEIGPVPSSSGGYALDPELDRLSNIIRDFNELFGNIDWRDTDKVNKLITEEIPAKVASDKAYQNAMRNSDKENARIEHDKVLHKIILEMMEDHVELFAQYSDNLAFKKWLSDITFNVTYQPPAV